MSIEQEYVQHINVSTVMPSNNQITVFDSDTWYNVLLMPQLNDVHSFENMEM